MKYFVLIYCISIINMYSNEEYHFLDDQKKIRRFRSIEESVSHITKKYENGTTWKLWYIMIATRSEGMHGDLLDVNNKSFYGKLDGEVKVIDGVTYIWYGTYESRKNLFDKSGWIPKNIEKYYPSKNLLTEFNTAPINEK